MKITDLLTIDSHTVSLVGVLLIGVVIVSLAFVKGWIVPGYIYKAKVDDCEKMTRLAFRNIDLAERSVSITEQIKSAADGKA
jgi:hypothetical protein